MTILVVIVAGLFAFVQLRATERRKTESLEAYADLLGRLVLSNLRDAMVTKDPGRLQALLTRISSIEPIVQVRVVNKPGEVIYANDPAAVGETLGRDDPSCASCHQDGRPPDRRSATVRLEAAGGREVFRAIHPIRVEPECVRCHDEPAGSVIGIVMTDIDRELLTGALGRQTTESIWAFAAAGVLILGVLALLVRRLIVARLQDLGRILELLRGGARSMSLTTASGDEIDELTRAAHGLALDLDERLDVERIASRAAATLDRHRGPALVLDPDGAVIAANTAARERFTAPDGLPLLGTPRGQLGGDVDGLLAAARDDGWALAEDETGPGLFALSGRGDRQIGLLELWPAEPGEAQDAGGDGDGESVDAPAPAPEGDAIWRLYGAVLLQDVSGKTSPWRGVLRLDPRLSLARRMIGELGQSALERAPDREEVDVKSVALLAQSDVRRRFSGIKWHGALDPELKIVGVRYQLRALWSRLTAAAALQAGEGGHVVQFCHRARAGDGDGIYLGAWASRAGTDGDTVLVDPPSEPPIAHAISEAHGDGFEVDPAYDLSKMTELHGLRVPADEPGTLYVARLARVPR